MKIAKYLFASAVLALAACAGNTDKAAQSAEAEEVVEEVAVEEVAPAADGAVTEIPAGTAQILPADVPTIIDFNAEWCGPCQRFKPIFHKVAEQFQGKAIFVSVNTDSCPDIAATFQVQSIPQIITVMPDGTASAGPTGFQEEADFTKYVESVVKN